jgi:hypothetical protein
MASRAVSNDVRCKVDVAVTALTKAGRTITRIAGVDPNKLPKRVLVANMSGHQSPVDSRAFDKSARARAV